MAKTDCFAPERFLAAIPGSLGIVSTIADRVGCAWGTAARYIAKYPEIREAYDNEHQSTLDYVESRLFDLINEKDGKSIRFYLSRKGRDRGYHERHTVDLKASVTEEVRADLASLPESTLRVLLANLSVPDCAEDLALQCVDIQEMPAE